MILFVLPLLEVAVFLLAIFTVVFVMSADGNHERYEQGQNYRM